MSLAIENSAHSRRKYKQSAACSTEGEYAYNLNPLRWTRTTELMDGMRAKERGREGGGREEGEGGEGV